MVSLNINQLRTYNYNNYRIHLLIHTNYIRAIILKITHIVTMLYSISHVRKIV